MDPAILLTLRLSFALLLAASAWHKRRDPGRFREALAGYEIVPGSLVAPVASALAIAEASIAAALATGGSAAVVGGIAAAALFLVYALAIQVNLARGRAGIDCGCMGPAARVPLSSALVARNFALAAAALTLAIPEGPRSLSPVDALSAVAATVVLAVCWLASERMLTLAPRAAILRARRRP